MRTIELDQSDGIIKRWMLDYIHHSSYNMYLTSTYILKPF